MEIAVFGAVKERSILRYGTEPSPVFSVPEIRYKEISTLYNRFMIPGFVGELKGAAEIVQQAGLGNRCSAVLAALFPGA
jgi:hypothetical protein